MQERSGPIQEGLSETSGGLEYYAYLPRSFGRKGRTTLLVAVHGISRNAFEIVSEFVPFAEEAGISLLAPRFDAGVFPDYQRLGRLGRGPRADLAIEAAIDSFARKHEVNFERRYFFGFSGGGQFVHRYLMAHPDRVDAAVIASAGWYTAPDSRARYPKGLRVAGSLPGIRFDPVRFLSHPMLVMVGERDTVRDTSIRTSRQLDRVQGRTRVERAEWWVARIREAARARGLVESCGLHVLPKAGHSFSDCVDAGLVDRLFAFISDTERRQQPSECRETSEEDRG